MIFNNFWFNGKAPPIYPLMAHFCYDLAAGEVCFQGRTKSASMIAIGRKAILTDLPSSVPPWQRDNLFRN
uniref:hypothetical protein n=1 Tax=Ochrobactrum sp. LM19 TaxID=1449781 RepID=UPI0015E7E938|nr:hypothetical protein [Ochrobactrum sp. LM19]